MQKRKWALVLALVLLACGMLAACSKPAETAATEAPVVTEAPDAAATEAPVAETPDETKVPEGEPEAIAYSQSPFLDGKDLPPLEERLPLVPKLVNETDASQLELQVGKFGGNLRFAFAQPEWNPDIFGACNEPLINTIGLLGTEYTGNVVESYEMSEDQKTFTFKMREGLKWSDGEPVTMEDIRFTYEDFLLNAELNASMPAKYCSAGKASGTPMQLNIIDDWTFQLVFDEAYGAFPVRIAIQGWVGYTDLLKPAHYLKQFHKDYAEADALAKLVADAGFQEGEWFNLFNLMDVTNWEITYEQALGFPCLNPWIITELGTQNAKYERNPYYFKVDAAGQQLPYIDTLENTVVANQETLSMAIIAGQVDALRESASMSNIVSYKENEANGNYTAYLYSSHAQQGHITINQTYADDTWKSVVQDVRFRRALSMAIDRDEIIQSVFYGQADVPSKLNDGKFDVAAANALLDEMGMVVGADGYRTAPNGEKFEFNFDVTARVAETIPATELYSTMFQDNLKVKSPMKTIENSLAGQRAAANELMASVERCEAYWWQGNMRWNQSFTTWYTWYTTNGESGEEPTQEVKDLFEQLTIVSSGAATEGYAAWEKLEDLYREWVYSIVVVENPKQPMILNSNLGNVPQNITTMGANFMMEQMYYK